jgi:anti-sigma regulatory factor (Ser/Thr protein kinase)
MAYIAKARSTADLAFVVDRGEGCSGPMLGPVRDALDRVGTDVGAWARESLALMTALPGVHRAGLAVAEGGGRRLRFTASDRTGSSIAEWCHVDAYDQVPLNAAIRTGAPVFGHLDDLGRKYAAFVERQRGTTTTALAAVPVVAAGQVLGGYVLFFEGPQSLDHRQRSRLAALGAQVGAALREAQHRAARPEVTLSDAPVPSGAAVAFHDVPPDTAAVAGARRFLRHTLQEWGVDEDTTEAAVLCLSELVTNALIHTPTGCAVRVLLDDGLLTTTVRDAGAADARTVEPLEDPLRVHVRGLQLVEAVASRWGSELDSVGTTVWFVLEP